ncbi:hypothetical protein FVP42_10860 [Lactococcus sp. dk310]|nr:hypothetical protein FVP42_10825 [Lactococcus sp. dk310]TXK36738.1 hypothetical protein FVP42_10860 [Lactococcus sp. dk310]
MGIALSIYWWITQTFVSRTGAIQSSLFSFLIAGVTFIEILVNTTKLSKENAIKYDKKIMTIFIFLMLLSSILSAMKLLLY